MIRVDKTDFEIDGNAKLVISELSLVMLKIVEETAKELTKKDDKREELKNKMIETIDIIVNNLKTYIETEM